MISLLNVGVVSSHISLKKVTQHYWGQKGYWVIVQKRERGAWQMERFSLANVPVRQSHINPGTACCTPRRGMLDSAGSLSRLEKFPLCFQEKPP
jgi:hypothetical protein